MCECEFVLHVVLKLDGIPSRVGSIDIKVYGR